MIMLKLSARYSPIPFQVVIGLVMELGHLSVVPKLTLVV